MAMHNSFAALQDNQFTRKWGGSHAGVVDPYVSGYFFVYWSYLPNKLGVAVKQVGGTTCGIETVTDCQTVLKSSCLAVTIPGGTVNKAEFTGLGGVKWSVPTNVEFDNTVTFKFLEFSTLPILSIIRGWVRLIRDYRTGISEVIGSEGAYTKSNYSATCYYWTTKPDGNSVEYYNCMTGLFPLKDPTDQYGADLTTIDKLEIDIDFSLDHQFVEDWVRDRCVSLSATAYGQRSVINSDGISDGGDSA